MKIPFAIGVIFVVICVVAILIVNAVRQSRRKKEAARIAAEQEAQRRAGEKTRRKEKDRQRAEEEEAQRKADEARLAAERDAQQKAEEERRKAEQEALRQAEEARLAAERAAQQKAEEVRQRAEQEDAQRKTEEARLAAERETQRRAEAERRMATQEEAQRKAEEARLAAEREAQQKTEDERQRAEQEAQRKAEQENGAEAVDDDQAGKLSPRTPRQYRPTPITQRGTTPRTRPDDTADRQTRDRSLPIYIRLKFERGGFVKITLLPQRAAGLPEEIKIAGTGDPNALIALQDDWYQDVSLPNMEEHLRNGVEWAGKMSGGKGARWSLGGREIYVLTHNNDLSGFLNVPRLVLGEEHVVLCVSEKLSAVREILVQTGSTESILMDSSTGLPAGWVALHGVIPHKPLASSDTGDILDALCPRAVVEIVLEGGIRIDRQVWLAGFPPRIRLRGDTSLITKMLIDSREAVVSSEGVYSIAGWDTLGDHIVSCEAGSRTYTIKEGIEEWQPWDAYRWSHGIDSQGDDTLPAICGVLVIPPRKAEVSSRSVLSPATNSVLIGANPGEITYCMQRNDIYSDTCVGFPWFEPVWAIPLDALHCDKRRIRVAYIGMPQAEQSYPKYPVTRKTQYGRTAAGRRIDAWCSAIHDAALKGLKTEPANAETAELWGAYKRLVKSIRRSWK